MDTVSHFCELIDVVAIQLVCDQLHEGAQYQFVVALDLVETLFVALQAIVVMLVLFC